MYKNVYKLTGLVTLARKIIFFLIFSAPNGFSFKGVAEKKFFVVAKILFLRAKNVCEEFEFYIMFSNILESSFWTTGKLAHVEIRGKVKF